ncbi:MAG: S8 family serine peptidase [Novosphingobium sp.]|uniref:S8 family serine peptidase n=1 Tax=Novosphingobium sp. TaxID=1874826 RepID=UPI0032BB848E
MIRLAGAVLAACLTGCLAVPLFAQVVGGPATQSPPNGPRQNIGSSGGGLGISLSLGGKKIPEPPLTGPALDMRDRAMADYVPDQVLVFLEDPAAQPARIAKAAKVTVLAVSPLPELGVTMVVARLAIGDTPEQAMARLAKDPKVAWAQPDFNFQVLGNSREQGAAISGIRIGPKHKVSGTIALIDSPVDIGNAALRGANIIQEGFGTALDPSSHGTAIAEILVGTGAFAGVAQGARLFSLAAFAPVGEDWWRSQSSRLVLALNRALALRPDVVNMSFGTARDDPALARALARFEGLGTCVVAAAGNGGGGPVLFPGRDPRVVAVTAIDSSKKAYAYASHGPEIDVAAWGVRMNAAVPGGRRAVSGTSFATAIVAGALLRGKPCGQQHNPAMMRAAVAAKAADLGPKGRDSIFGAGLFRLP